MQPDPVPILIPAFPRDPCRPRRIHENQPDATPPALPLQRNHHLPRTEVRENTPEPLSVLPQPRLLLPEVQVLRNHGHAPRRSPVTDRLHRHLHAVPVRAKLLTPGPDQPPVSRHMRNREMVRVHVHANRTIRLFRHVWGSASPSRHEICVDRASARRALEPSSPYGAEALEWLLLTTLPVGNADEARRILDLYALR